jgi:hypothetical protein
MAYGSLPAVSLSPLVVRRKSESDKLVVAVRLRRETTLSIRASHSLFLPVPFCSNNNSRFEMSPTPPLKYVALPCSMRYNVVDVQRFTRGGNDHECK